ncbi:MAG: DsrE family protein [Gammaproteobacteria bacterium]|nr:DsrE family protein [Gammaproteobacteria bacterium]
MKQTKRRQFLSLLGFGGIGLAGVSLSSNKAHAHHTDTHFDDKAAHRLVYQCNRADHDYIEHVLFSCAEMLRKYGDDIELVISAFGPGLNLLARRPKRSISKLHQQRVASLAEYGVRFQACGNTMKSMNWLEKDLVEQAQVVPIGVDGIMQLQEQGFSYINM